MENKTKKVLIPVTVVQITIDDAREILGIDENNGTIDELTEQLKHSLQQQLDSIDNFKNFYVRKVIAFTIQGYIEHENVIYCAFTILDKVLQNVIDKRFEIISDYVVEFSGNPNEFWEDI